MQFCTSCIILDSKGLCTCPIFVLLCPHFLFVFYWMKKFDNNTCIHDVGKKNTGYWFSIGGIIYLLSFIRVKGCENKDKYGERKLAIFGIDGVDMLIRKEPHGESCGKKVTNFTVPKSWKTLPFLSTPCYT